MKAQETGQSTLAEYFLSKEKDNIYIMKKNGIYTWNDTTKLWSNDDEEPLTPLQNIVRNFIKAEITKDYDTVEAITDSHIKSKLKQKLIQVQKSWTGIDILAKLAKTIRDIANCERMYPDIEFDSNPEVWNFNNGQLNIRTGEFRERVRDDHISVCLPDDYSPEINESIVRHILELLKQNFNDSDEQLNAQLSWMAYSLTGDKSIQRYFCYIGAGASNGKTTLLEIITKTFPKYAVMLAPDTFSKTAIKNGGSLAMLQQPLRMTYIEELQEEELNAGLLKAFTGGKKITVKGLYRNTRELNLQAKLTLVSNHNPTLKWDKGTERRTYVQRFHNIFCETEIEMQLAKKPAEGRLIMAESDLSALFDDVNYRMALISVLLQYTKRFYRTKRLEPMFYAKRDAIAMRSEGGDPFGDFVKNNIVKETGRVLGKVELANAFNEFRGIPPRGATDKEISHVVREMKKNVEFKFADGVRGEQIKIQGAFIGVRLKTETEAEQDEEPLAPPSEYKAPTDMVIIKLWNWLENCE
jgi:phage/plasmid-associated DNA primase